MTNSGLFQACYVSFKLSKKKKSINIVWHVSLYWKMEKNDDLIRCRKSLDKIQYYFII